jgi:hypothetical protein
MSRIPDFVDYQYPLSEATVSPSAPLVHIATAGELRTMTVVDPIVGDTVTCADLFVRDRACWDAADARWPPRDSYALSPSERERAFAARRMCSRRALTLLRVCRVGAVHAG